MIRTVELLQRNTSNQLILLWAQQRGVPLCDSLTMGKQVDPAGKLFSLCLSGLPLRKDMGDPKQIAHSSFGGDCPLSIRASVAEWIQLQCLLYECMAHTRLPSIIPLIQSHHSSQFSTRTANSMSTKRMFTTAYDEVGEY
jgi:hypothetical protein